MNVNTAEVPTRQAETFPWKTELADGTRVLIRPLTPQDRRELVEGFTKLSLRSRRLRFASPFRKLTEAQLDSLLAVDQTNHVAFGVRDIGRPERPGIAVCRFVRLQGEPDTAEFAVTVLDEYQHRGLGGLLCRLLMSAAAEQGLRVLRGYLLADNAAMIRLLERFGARLHREGGNMLRAEIDLEAIPRPAGDGFRLSLRRVCGSRPTPVS
jgi:RimJ/RimL family protein N-acetyltransferase